MKQSSLSLWLMYAYSHCTAGFKTLPNSYDLLILKEEGSMFPWEVGIHLFIAAMSWLRKEEPSVSKYSVIDKFENKISLFSQGYKILRSTIPLPCRRVSIFCPASMCVMCYIPKNVCTCICCRLIWRVRIRFFELSSDLVFTDYFSVGVL